MSKISELEGIAEEIAKCKECKRGKSGLPVPGEGNPQAKIFFAGEAPGPLESKTGKPFVGRAGKFLTKILTSIKLAREKVFITSPVKFYPGRRAPTDEEIEHGKIHLLKQIETIQPKLIVLLGNVALKALLNEKWTVSQVHGKLFRDGCRLYFPTFHPSAAMRFTKIQKETKKDFKKLKRIIVGL